MKSAVVAAGIFVISTIPALSSSLSLTDRDSWIASDFGFRFRLGYNSTDFYVVDNPSFERTLSLPVTDPFDDLRYISTAAVRGSFATGSIGLEATSDIYGSSGAIDRAVISMKDVIFFDLRSVTESNPTVKFSYVVEAEFFDTSSTLSATFGVKNETAPGNDLARAAIVYDGAANRDSFDPQAIFSEDLIRAVSLGPSQYELELDLVPGVVNTVSLDSIMIGQDGVNAWNSATTTIITSFDYTSASGVFLSATTVSQVPLPASSLLILSGLAGLGVMRRRKHAGR